MIVALFGTFFVYFLSIILFRSILDVDFILADYNLLYVFALTFSSWLPFYLFKKIRKCISPDQLQQLRKFNQVKNINLKDHYSESKSHKLLT